MKSRKNHIISAGGVIADPGNTADRLTGDWRVKRPVIELDKCTHCMICWIYCPDSAIEVKEGRFIGFDLIHCKGCGICAEECPPNCIDMIEESTFQEITGIIGKEK
jgi:2-oxoacid:acceptor oxidoreductase delta subunit (pyruvate/2-ketoisovalerate family)|tara:strand:+ start:731 stop:1048 length:318 start_codon:yes stop_codon:yes gene_type:complete